MLVSLFNKHDKIFVGDSKVIDCRTQSIKQYKDGYMDTVNSVVRYDGKTHVNMVIENDYITVYHEKGAYWGFYKDGSIGFHFFIDGAENSLQTTSGRLEEFAYKEKYEISQDLKSVKGNVVAMLVQAPQSKLFTFEEKKKVFKVIVKDNFLKIGTLQFMAVLITNPLTNEALKAQSSRDALNAYIDYDGVCDFNFDFGIGWKQSIKSRDDYYQLFRQRYDIRVIIFADWLPAASSLFKTFENCFSLEEVDITKIQGSATVFTRCFANCKKLKVLKMNKNKNACRIGGMFSGCISLESVIFPFEELSACKKWRNDTGKLEEIRCPLMNGWMKMVPM